MNRWGEGDRARIRTLHQTGPTVGAARMESCNQIVYVQVLPESTSDFERLS